MITVEVIVFAMSSGSLNFFCFRDEVNSLLVEDVRRLWKLGNKLPELDYVKLKQFNTVKYYSLQDLPIIGIFNFK